MTLQQQKPIIGEIRVIPRKYTGLQNLSERKLFELRKSIAELPNMLPQEQELNNLSIREYMAQFVVEIQNKMEQFMYY